MACSSNSSRLITTPRPSARRPGHYAIRGGIIDVYPVTANQPYRLDFFGDELEEIREFDPVTQRSGASVASITLSASPRVRLAESTTGIADYLSTSTHLAFIEPRVARGGIQRVRPRRHQRPHAAARPLRRGVGISDLDEASALFDNRQRGVDLDTESLAHPAAIPRVRSSRRNGCKSRRTRA